MYVLNRERHTVGQRTPSSKPSISLSAPDILPLHCTLRRHHPSDPEQAGDLLVLEPIPGAPIAVNFSEVGGRTVVLRHGDLLSLGLYYLLLFKEPAQARPLPAQALARLRALPLSCRLCGAQLRASGASRPRRLHLEFEPGVEDALVQRIVTLVEPGSDDHQLAPAFLLCLCIEHSATRLQPGSFGQLLLKIAKTVREAVWVSLGPGRAGPRQDVRGPPLAEGSLLRLSTPLAQGTTLALHPGGWPWLHELWSCALPQPSPPFGPVLHALCQGQAELCQRPPAGPLSTGGGGTGLAGRLLHMEDLPCRTGSPGP